MLEWGRKGEGDGDHDRRARPGGGLREGRLFARPGARHGARDPRPLTKPWRPRPTCASSSCAWRPASPSSNKARAEDRRCPDRPDQVVHRHHDRPSRCDRGADQAPARTVLIFRLMPRAAMTAYAELQVTSNFSFLRGGAHPEELVLRAGELGHRGARADRSQHAGRRRARAMSPRRRSASASSSAPDSTSPQEAVTLGRSSVTPGLDPGSMPDGRVKPGHDAEGSPPARCSASRPTAPPMAGCRS